MEWVIRQLGLGEPIKDLHLPSSSLTPTLSKGKKTKTLHFFIRELKFEGMRASFPQEVIEGILFRLPIKSLIICTSVCKSWRSMIKSQIFIDAHLRHSIEFTNQHGTHLLLLHSVSGASYNLLGHLPFLGDPIKEVFSLHLDNHAFDEYCKIEFPIFLKETVYNQFFRVVGICNGLVCLSDDLHRYCCNFIIWNPSIRKSVTLPMPSFTYETHMASDDCIGFGYDAMTNDYKIVRLVRLYNQPERQTVAEVYSLAMGSWRRLDPLTPEYSIGGREPQAFVNGALHWAINCNDWYFIMTFDVGSELFGKIMMPKRLERNESSVFQLSVSGDRKSIALFAIYRREGGCNWHNDFFDSFLDIWVMKEYSMEESWTKLITLGPQGPERSLSPEWSIEMMELIRGPEGRDKSLLARALFFRKSSEEVLVLVGARHELVSLDLESQQIKILGIGGYQYCYVDSFEESLVLLNKSDAVSY